MEDEPNSMIENQPGPTHGWDIKDTHIEKISFTDVSPVNIQMRQVSVDVTTSRGLQGIFSKAQSSHSDPEADNPKTKRILDRTSADFPKGSLCAIMGGSGSGKVRCYSSGFTYGLTSC